MHRKTGAAFAIMGALAVLGAAVSFANGGAIKSGVEKGGSLSAFEPKHVTGPDKMTATCPVCKYPYDPAVQVWVNTDDDKNISTLAKSLEKTVDAHTDKKMHAFVVYINPKRLNDATMTSRLSKLGEASDLQRVALTYLPGPDHDAVTDYKINTSPKVKNTVFVYKNRKVAAKFINFVADKKGLDALNSAIKTIL